MNQSSVLTIRLFHRVYFAIGLYIRLKLSLNVLATVMVIKKTQIINLFLLNEGCKQDWYKRLWVQIVLVLNILILVLKLKLKSKCQSR